MPLMGDREPLDALAAEYAQVGSRSALVITVVRKL